MAYVSYQTFYDNYLPKDGERGTQAVFQRSPLQLKKELDETTVIQNIMNGINPPAWNSTVTYKESDIVTGTNGETYYRSKLNTNLDKPLTNALWWEDKTAQYNAWKTTLSVSNQNIIGPIIYTSHGGSVVIPSASATTSGVITTTTQSFAGTKTFTGSVTIQGTLTESSDKRIKENIKPLENALDKVLALTGVSFNKISYENTEIGFIAQDIQEVLPELVIEDGQGMLSVSYARTVALLVEAVKEQNNVINMLKQRIKNIEEK